MLKSSIALTAFLTLSFPAQAQQQPKCGPYQNVVKFLADKYGEARVATGRTGAETILVVLASENGETFTVLKVNIKGIACFLATGTGWTPEQFDGSGMGEPA